MIHPIQLTIDSEFLRKIEKLSKLEEKLIERINLIEKKISDERNFFIKALIKEVKKLNLEMFRQETRFKVELLQINQKVAELASNLSLLANLYFEHQHPLTMHFSVGNAIRQISGKTRKPITSPEKFVVKETL